MAFSDGARYFSRRRSQRDHGANLRFFHFLLKFLLIELDDFKNDVQILAQIDIPTAKNIRPTHKILPREYTSAQVLLISLLPLRIETIESQGEAMARYNFLCRNRYASRLAAAISRISRYRAATQSGSPI